MELKAKLKNLNLIICSQNFRNCRLSERRFVETTNRLMSNQICNCHTSLTKSLSYAEHISYVFGAELFLELEIQVMINFKLKRWNTNNQSEFGGFGAVPAHLMKASDNERLFNYNRNNQFLNSSEKRFRNITQFLFSLLWVIIFWVIFKVLIL